MDFFLKKPKHDSVHIETLSPDNVLKLQLDIIARWKDKRETFFLRHGSPIMGAFGAVSGIIINNHYRNKLKLGNYGRLSSYLPIVVLPAIGSSIVHTTFIQPEFMLNKQPCAICTQIKGGLVQASLAVAYPMVLAPLASFMFASRHYTYRMPTMFEKPAELWKLYVKMTTPMLTRISILFCGNLIVGMYFTYREIIDFHTIMAKLEKRIDKIENS